MGDPLQPPLPQPPNWGAYVAGVDTIQWYYITQADITATETYWFGQKITNPQQDNIFRGAVLAAPGRPTLPGIGKLSGSQFSGDTTNGTAQAVAGKANIPNSLPGGYTP